VFDERAAVVRYQSQQAAKGNPEALYAMGIRFLNGIYVAQNEVQARDYLEQAKKKGNLRARAKLEELVRTKREAEANPPAQVCE
jgi:TPR repeat protein